ncbi:hypothetical protein HU755_06380 [Pseudomonas sp. SWRI111]|uniref:hypothetical protein n=1 Tax=unclassified Pseudomonas TaxID=196821 RepID=UPI0016449344|nr:MULTISPECIES: hypothetical protein [unclassified Pseudomonas]MBC3206409.1 hypothetical protein [Pseudomonas sp. SWRI111]MBC3268423.1 hypothetical protein [Pseudomonas sp. SWRI81]
MNAQKKALTAPIVKEAIANQLKLSVITNDVVTAQIIAVESHFPTGKVHLFATMGEAIFTASGEISTPPQILELALPKSFFEEHLATAKVSLFYIVITKEGTVVTSLAHELSVVE